jgi:hypothetical protein
VKIWSFKAEHEGIVETLRRKSEGIQYSMIIIQKSFYEIFDMLNVYLKTTFFTNRGRI